MIQPEILTDELGSLTVRPSDQWARIRHTLLQPGVFPLTTPRWSIFLRGPPGLVRPLFEPYLHRFEKTRDKDLKRHGDLDHQAHTVQFTITSLMVIMAERKRRVELLVW
jgi:hypothetical protein